MKKIFTILILFAALSILFYSQFEPANSMQWGVNFSIPHAQYLGFDWKRMFLDILEELKPKLMRVPVYWELVEPQRGKFNFADYDFILNEAQRHDSKIILVVGHKLPRWPECHEPQWAQNMEYGIWNMELLDYVRETVFRYKNNPAVAGWQVENEPFFPFGPDCQAIPEEFFAKEVALVKSLDSKPVVVTDSGEKGDWLRTARYGDIFGSTMYREIYHHKKQKFVKYPIPPALYRLKAGMVKVLTKVDKFIGVELQAEPWFPGDVSVTPWEEQEVLMNEQIFKDNVEYARAVGFAQNYFWGVEWWYYAKNIQGDDAIWQEAKKIISE